MGRKKENATNFEKLFENIKLYFRNSAKEELDNDINKKYEFLLYRQQYDEDPIIIKVNKRNTISNRFKYEIHILYDLEKKIEIFAIHVATSKRIKLKTNIYENEFDSNIDSYLEGFNFEDIMAGIIEKLYNSEP